MDLSNLVSVASLLLWAAAFLYFRSYLKRRTGAERILGEFREEVDKLVADIDAAADRDSALVEERVRTLRAVLEDADKKIAVYVREVSRREGEERAYAEFGRRGRPSAVPPQAPIAAPAPQAPAVAATVAPVRNANPVVTQPDATPKPVPSSAPEAGAPTTAQTAAEGARAPVPAESAPRFTRSSSPVQPKGPSFAERAAELYLAGFSADLIAKRLGATVAEVDLAIALARRMDAGNDDDSGN